MVQLSSLTMSRKLGLIIGSALVGIAILCASFLVQERSLIMDERQAAVRQTVEIAHGVIAHAHDQVKQGKLSEAEGKAQAMAALRAHCSSVRRSRLVGRPLNSGGGWSRNSACSFSRADTLSGVSS